MQKRSKIGRVERLGKYSLKIGLERGREYKGR
jgi:hypothetical protein